MRNLGDINDSAPQGICVDPAQPVAAAPAPAFVFPAGLLELQAPGRGVDAEDSSVLQPDVDVCETADWEINDADWWLVYTKSRQEKQLSRQLSQMQVPHYLPVHTREAITRGRTRLVEEPLFSGYLFLYGDDDHRRAALTTNRISTTYPVPDPRRLRYELRQIAQSIAAGARLTVEAQLAAGDWVRIKNGAYQGLEGVVLRRKNETRLLLSVDFLTQGASLEIHDSQLERINPPLFDDSASIEINRRGM